MTDKNYSHIAILADRTASMGRETDPGHTRASDTTEGIQVLIAEQAAQPGRTTFSLTDFNSYGVTRIAWFAPGDNRDLRGWKCRPAGNTPLLDAVGKVIYETGVALEAMPEAERPSRVFFVIGTDGEENASREYKLAQVRDMITRQQDVYGWDFVFIGAGIDAFADAGDMGIATASTMSASPSKMKAAYGSTSTAMSRSRAGGQSVSYSDDERTQASDTP